MANISTRQSLTQYSDLRKAYKLNDRTTEDFAALKNDVHDLVELINNADAVTLDGLGSPENVVVSNSSRLYVDRTNEPASVELYFNPNVGVSTGWITFL